MRKNIRFLGFKFEPRDLWIGVYWTKERHCTDTPNELCGIDAPDVTCMELTLCICPLPMLLFKWRIYYGFKLGF